MDIDHPAPARSLTRCHTQTGGIRVTHPHPWPYALLAIDGAWRHGVVGGWHQARAGAPVALYVEWTDDVSTRIDHVIYEDGLVIPGQRDIWGPRPPR
ncbi:hypothetical protein ACIBSV_46910 [Embleya sp. NPDC050154]|uniref:hypothetical protein n=1 Tax=Embleya sp. NPDC050154 TaxID=3363988 RepID=UPI0037AEA1F4